MHAPPTRPISHAEGWKLVTLLRLSPIAPWNVLNYALSVTAVPLAAYFLASALAVRPLCWLFAARLGTLILPLAACALVVSSATAV